MTIQQLSVYHHTHWDREWYLPFRLYQRRLVPVIEAILERLEKNQLSVFVLDGQTEILKDLLELRPDLDSRLRALIEAQRLTIGPWRLMPDELLVSGESLLRNLIGGIRVSRAWGCNRFTGYLPDTFGHSADMPLILKQVGLNSAVVWRGINPQQSLFRWKHSSGAEILALHLTDGYFQDALHDNLLHNNGLSPLTDPQTITQTRLAQLNAWLARTQAASPDGRVLLPIGADHLGPVSPAELPILKEWAAGAVETTPERFLAATSPELLPQLEQVSGPLLDCSASFLLPGTWSSRLYLKQANRKLEHQLTRYVEPLLAWQTLFSPADRKPEDHASLALAWTLLLLNHPHDSICGCSVDPVHRENEVRFDQAGQLAESLIFDSQRKLGKRLFPKATQNHWVLWNQGDTPWSGVVPLRERVDSVITDPEASGLTQPGTTKTVLEDSYRATTQIVPLAHRTMIERHGWIWTEKPIPPYGVALQPKSAEPFRLPDSVQPAKGVLDSITALPVLDNGLLTVTLEKKGVENTLRVCIQQPVIEQSGEHSSSVWLSLTVQPDAGDSYTSALCNADQVQTARLIDAQLEHQGPLVCSLLVHYQFESLSTSPITPDPIEVRLFLKANDPLLEIQCDFTPARPDQKLQLRFHTASPLSRLWMESHFSLQERPLRYTATVPEPAQKGQELPVATHPVQRFLLAETAPTGLMVITEGLTEAETYPDALGITLWRGFGILSRPDTRSRAGQAGPPLPTPEGQGLNRAMQTRLGLKILGSVTGYLENPAPLWETANQFYGTVHGEQALDQSSQITPESTDVFSSDASPNVSAHCMLRWDNPRVVSTACTLETLPSGKEAFVLRLLNPGPVSQTVRLTLGFPYREISTGNALGEVLTPVIENRVEIKPFDLQTVWIKPANT